MRETYADDIDAGYACARSIKNWNLNWNRSVFATHFHYSHPLRLHRDNHRN